MDVDRPGRPGALLNALIAVLLAIAVVIAIAFGLRALGLAQTGELRDLSVPRDPDVLAQPELAPEAAPVFECTDARGTRVYSNEPCAGGPATTRSFEVTTIELPPPRP